MTDQLTEHPLTQQLVHALRYEGFSSSLDVDEDDEYVILTIQRDEQYY